jgi:DNA-binding MarR family transcriptional regulator
MDDAARKTPEAPRREAPYRLEDQVGHVLRRVYQRASAIFQAHIDDPNVTPTQFAALVKLHDEGQLSQNHLGRLTAMDRATIQGVIRRLVGRALIVAEADPGDKRRTLLRLTDAGEVLVGRLIQGGRAVSAATLEPLTAAERKALLGLLRKIS